MQKEKRSLLPASGQKHLILIALAVFLTICLIAGVLDSSAKGMHPFIFTQYLFSYETEFIKRGLVGEILRHANLPRTQLTVGVLLEFLMEQRPACYAVRCLVRSFFGRIVTVDMPVPVGFPRRTFLSLAHCGPESAGR